MFFAGATRHFPSRSCHSDLAVNSSPIRVCMRLLKLYSNSVGGEWCNWHSVRMSPVIYAS